MVLGGLVCGLFYVRCGVGLKVAWYFGSYCDYLRFYSKVLYVCDKIVKIAVLSLWWVVSLGVLVVSVFL